MRFTTATFTPDWQRSEKVIAAGCAISVVVYPGNGDDVKIG